jgi:hypothetical protein
MTTFVVFTLSSPLWLWVFFIILFNTFEGKTPWWSLPFWLVGAVVDIYVNIWASILFLELPNKDRLFLSARMDYLILHNYGWRGRLAILIVGYLLEPFDRSVPKQHTTHGAFK